MHVATASIFATALHFTGLYLFWLWRQDASRWLFAVAGVAALCVSGLIIAWAHIHVIGRALLAYIGLFGALAVLAMRFQQNTDISRYDFAGLLLMVVGSIVVGVGPLLSRR